MDMKILVVKPNGGAFYYITKAFINAFNDIGCNAMFWDGDEKFFNDFKPDLYIGASGHRQNIPKNYNGKIAIHVNPYGVKLDPINNVDINESQDAINWTIKNHPDIVFGYGHQDDSKTYWRDWYAKHSIKFVGVPTAGDVIEYYIDKKQCDYKIAYFGGRWPYKGHNIDKWLVPVLDKLSKISKVHGWGGWQGKSYYHGPLPNDDNGRSFLSSALVCPCICEPHTSKYGIDIPERFFKVSLCGSLPILDYVNGFSRYMTKYIMASNPDEYYNLILNYSSNPDYINEGKKIAIEIRNEVLKKHTYHNRMMDLCNAIGFYHIAENFEKKIKSFQVD